MTTAPIAATNASVAAAEFADAMSTLASGVVLVTCRLADRPWGMTVTAFASVSAYPPTVLVSLGAGTASARAIAATGAFGVSILSRDQVDVAEYGAARGAAKFLDDARRAPRSRKREPCDRAGARAPRLRSSSRRSRRPITRSSSATSTRCAAGAAATRCSTTAAATARSWPPIRRPKGT